MATVVDRGDPALSICYSVAVDGEDLGAFTTCEGLGCEVVLEQREEGGNNGFVWQLPSRIKYSNVKLTRPICKDSANLTKWLAGFASGVKLRTATINARGSDGEIIASWSLDGVLPVRWSGPSLNPDSPKVAMETIELAHHGFLPGRVAGQGATSGSGGQN
ncbi:MAG TPA: phage tail protein [Candidatus Limnocylindrales bacterium]